MNNKAKVITLMILLSLIASSPGPKTSAAVNQSRSSIINEIEYHNGIKNVKEKTLSSVYNKNVGSYKRVEYTINGKKLSVQGFEINKVKFHQNI